MWYNVATNGVFGVKVNNKVLFKVSSADLTNGKFIIPEGITKIAAKAFAGLNELTAVSFPKSLVEIGDDAFLDCPNLETYAIFSNDYWSRPINLDDLIRKHPNLKKLYILHKKDNLELQVHTSWFWKSDKNPISEVYIYDGITTIGNYDRNGCFSPLFEKATKIYLPTYVRAIYKNSFTNAKNLQSIFIPKSIKNIEENAFGENVELVIEGIGTFKSNDLIKLETSYTGDNTKILYFNNQNYIIGNDKIGYLELFKEDFANNLSYHPEFLLKNLEKLFNYLFNLVKLNKTHHQELINCIENKDLIKLLESDLDDGELIKEILKLDLKDEFLFGLQFIDTFSYEDNNGIELIVTNMSPFLRNFFKYAKCFEYENICDRFNKYRYDLFSFKSVDKLIAYCNLLEKYQRFDKFFYNINLATCNDMERLEKFISKYNANTKRLIKASGVLEGQTSIDYVLKMCDILGVFSDDERLSQRMTTFITEKLFLSQDEIKKKFPGIYLTSIFDSVKKVRSLDLDFLEFFIDNYNSLLEKEALLRWTEHKNLISKIYDEFEEIKECSTSNKGRQRYLKVTLQKCIDYFGINSIVSEKQEERDIETLVDKYYGSYETTAKEEGKRIVKEAKKAPRNIFCDSNDTNCDLSGSTNNDFSYEWLPKQDVINLFLGKLCSNCAHIYGDGNGIMRYSMISDNAQNMVIKNSAGKIIGKATLVIDRENGFGVYNTIGINSKYEDNDSLEKIYDTFIAGTEAFIKAYNTNYSSPITVVNIGTSYNSLISCFDNHNHAEVEALPIIDFSNYGFTYGEVHHDFILNGYYKGDAKTQKSVLVKEKKMK